MTRSPPPQDICARARMHKAKANRVTIRPSHPNALPLSGRVRSWPARKKKTKLVTIFRTASRVAPWSAVKPASNCTAARIRNARKGQSSGDQLILRTPRWAQPPAHRISARRDRTIKAPHAHGCTAPKAHGAPQIVAIRRTRAIVCKGDEEIRRSSCEENPPGGTGNLDGVGVITGPSLGSHRVREHPRCEE